MISDVPERVPSLKNLKNLKNPPAAFQALSLTGSLFQNSPWFGSETTLFSLAAANEPIICPLLSKSKILSKKTTDFQGWSTKSV